MSTSIQKFITKRYESIRHATNGLYLLIKTETHAQIHLVATMVVLVAGMWFSISRAEWVQILLSLGLVWLAEALNTAIERLCDRLIPQFDANIKQIKDIAAAAVWVCALIAIIIGGLVFIPYLV